MGETYTTLSNNLNVKVLNYEFVKAEIWPGNQTNLNKGLLKDKRVSI